MEVGLALARHAERSAEHSPETVQPDEPRPAPRRHPGVAAKVWAETNLDRRYKINKPVGPEAFIHLKNCF